MEKQQEIKNLLEKVEKLKKEHKLDFDLSSDEDLSIAIMNLISLEEHFFFTGIKTDKTDYFDFLNQIREMRKELLKKIVKDPEGEIWCISKHLLAASMRLMEVGTKYYNRGNKEDAQKMFSQSHDLFSLFWGINLKLVNLDQVKKIDDNQLNVSDKHKTGLLGKIGETVKKLLDCCKE